MKYTRVNIFFLSHKIETFTTPHTRAGIQQLPHSARNMVVEKVHGKSRQQWVDMVIEYSPEGRVDLEAIYNMTIHELVARHHEITKSDGESDESMEDEVINSWLNEATEVKKAYRKLVKDKKNAPKSQRKMPVQRKKPAQPNSDTTEDSDDEERAAWREKLRKMNVFQKFLSGGRINMNAAAYATYVESNELDITRPVLFRKKRFKRLEYGRGRYYWVELTETERKEIKKGDFY